MSWLCLFACSLVLWGLCGAVIALGRKLWSERTTLYVHLIAAPCFAFLMASVFKYAFPAFDPLLRAEVMTAIIIALDLFVVAPFLERSFAMFKSLIGTWIPFAAIFVASWIA